MCKNIETYLRMVQILSPMIRIWLSVSAPRHQSNQSHKDRGTRYKCAILRNRICILRLWHIALHHLSQS